MVLLIIEKFRGFIKWGENLLNRRKIKSMELIEILLIFLFVILMLGSLFFIGKELAANTTIYKILMGSIIFITTLVTSIVIFAFVKRKYIEVLKVEIEEDFDKFKIKLEDKVLTTNNRIFGFETNYSKKLKKIMKDYNIKVKEIENIKKELNTKLAETDRKAAYLEIEISKIKLENILSKEINDSKEIKAIYNRIIKLNELYPGTCDEKFLAEVRSEL